MSVKGATGVIACDNEINQNIKLFEQNPLTYCETFPGQFF